ncbi:hypothetical protein M316_0066 [Nitrincola phage 1M3-16]|uniref:hypothetical protein n=1 Tax=Nitrincola phage 1M3-16 TaxID=1472912 RepID=UPI000444AE9B|nr:hypothetical protein GJ22_gp086 [Nitrincola phage 1M3-16]AHX01131.1 hypothetical protein M316_0066 [Nitrincola phage 1M3-16]
MKRWIWIQVFELIHNSTEDIFVAGGAETFEVLCDEIDGAYITEFMIGEPITKGVPTYIPKSIFYNMYYAPMTLVRYLNDETVVHFHNFRELRADY